MYDICPFQRNSIISGDRAAKEALLSPGGEDRHPITIAGRGSKVIGGSLRIDLFRDEVFERVLDGFFPQNARSLRGERMVDLLFQGSANYKAQSLAQVNLIVDNTNRQLPLDFSKKTVLSLWMAF